MLMAPHNGAVEENMGGGLTALRLETCPELSPNAAGLPAAEAVVDGIPMAKLGGRVPPGNASAGVIEGRLDIQAVAQFRWTAGFVLQSGENRFNLRPSGIREERADIGVALHALVIEANVRRSRAFVNRTQFTYDVSESSDRGLYLRDQLHVVQISLGPMHFNKVQPRSQLIEMIEHQYPFINPSIAVDMGK
jgi:hypothetical protein